MEPREFWQKIYERFDPQEPVSRAEWRVARPYSPADQILRDLHRPFGDKRYLLYGTVGSGKTSELLWLASQRASEDIVVFVDLQRHFVDRVGDANALQNLQPWEVIFLVGLSVFATGQSLLGHRWSGSTQQGLADAAARFFPGSEADTPSIDVVKLASTMAALASAPAATLGGGIAAAAAGALTAVGAGLGAAKWNISIGRRERRPTADQEERVQQLLRVVNGLIRELREHYRQLTVVLDGLDRIINPETSRALFIESMLLGQLDCPTILCGSISLRRSGFAGRVRGFEMKPLVNIPVMARSAPTVNGPGIELCWQVYRRRVQDIDPDGARFPRPVFERLARCSGGRMRDLIRLVRLVAEAGWDEALEAATEEAVAAAINQRRRIVEQGINRKHITVLQSVIDDPQYRLPADDVVVELLDNFWLLPYPNESEWWYPHPLLMLNILKRTG